MLPGEEEGDTIKGRGGSDIIVEGGGDDYLLSTFEGRLFGDTGDDILESRGEIAGNEMRGGPGADEYRCNETFDSVGDYNEDECDTIVGECEEVIDRSIQQLEGRGNATAATNGNATAPPTSNNATGSSSPPRSNVSSSAAAPTPPPSEPEQPPQEQQNETSSSSSS
jgi:Ca2+-binding RTX toxin-like protein